jgi:hypothetical protein
MLTTTMGRITISNANGFSSGNRGFQISALLQELMVYAGTLDSYGRSNKILEKFLSIKVSTTQIFRLTDLYGEQLGKHCDFTRRSELPLPDQEILYVEADTSMLLTREHGYKDVKVGRVFKSSDCLHPDDKPGAITHSQYLAQMGGHRGFTGKMEALIEDYTINQQQLVFLSDGAPWLRNWIADAFPGVVSILDFYHLLEHLCQFAEAFFSEKAEADQWVEKQKALFLESEATEVMEGLAVLPAAKGKQKLKTKLLAYLKANQNRMDYKHYSQIGCGIIGSGAIESAHRTVVQKRMKLSGQRWSKKGAGHLLNLRVIYMNRQWNKVIHLAKTNFATAA